MNFFNAYKPVHLPPDGTAATTWGLAAGTTSVNSGSVDRRFFEKVAFMVVFGDNVATGTFVAKVQHSDDNSTWADALDLDGNTITVSFTAGATDSDNKMIGKEVMGTKLKRYVRLAFARGTANTVIESVWAFLGSPQKQPVAQDATSAGQFYAAPATIQVCS